MILDCVCGWMENHRGASTETVWDILKCVRYNQLTDKEITEFSDRVFQGMPEQLKGKSLLSNPRNVDSSVDQCNKFYHFSCFIQNFRTTSSSTGLMYKTNLEMKGNTSM